MQDAGNEPDHSVSLYRVADGRHRPWCSGVLEVPVREADHKRIWCDVRPRSSSHGRCPCCLSAKLRRSQKEVRTDFAFYASPPRTRHSCGQRQMRQARAPANHSSRGKGRTPAGSSKNTCDVGLVVLPKGRLTPTGVLRLAVYSLSRGGTTSARGSRGVWWRIWPDSCSCFLDSLAPRFGGMR
jgi:hypothetical protein